MKIFNWLKTAWSWIIKALHVIKIVFLNCIFIIVSDYIVMLWKENNNRKCFFIDISIGVIIPIFIFCFALALVPDIAKIILILLFTAFCIFVSIYKDKG